MCKYDDIISIEENLFRKENLAFINYQVKLPLMLFFFCTLKYHYFPILDKLFSKQH